MNQLELGAHISSPYAEDSNIRTTNHPRLHDASLNRSKTENANDIHSDRRSRGL